MIPFPSYAEHDGLYNVSRAQARRLGNEPVARSVAAPPLLKPAERRAARKALISCLRRHGHDLGIPDAELTERYKPCVCTIAEDRTLGMFLPDWREFTPALVRRMQRQVVATANNTGERAYLFTSYNAASGAAINTERGPATIATAVRGRQHNYGGRTKEETSVRMLTTGRGVVKDRQLVPSITRRGGAGALADRLDRPRRGR